MVAGDRLGRRSPTVKGPEIGRCPNLSPAGQHCLDSCEKIKHQFFAGYDDLFAAQADHKMRGNSDLNPPTVSAAWNNNSERAKPHHSWQPLPRLAHDQFQ